MAEQALQRDARARGASGGSLSLRDAPKGLGVLVFTELWERFSYFGLTSNLVLYMTHELLVRGHAGVLGLAGLRRGLESLFGPLSTLAFASQIYGLYTGFVYFTPVFGGLIADRWLGRRKAVILGAILMSAGHFTMAFDASFLVALLLIIVGCGFLKGNISSQVGDLYAPDDEAARARGFQIFSVGINIGAMAGPFVCGLLAQVWGWHVGFAAAGVLMLVGLATYLIGARRIPEAPRVPRTQRPASPITAEEAKVLAVLVATISATVLISIACYQKLNIGLVWIDSKVDLNAFGFRVPVAWFTTVAPLTSIVGVPLVLALWNRQAQRGREPSDVGKMATGAWLAAFANLGLSVAAALMPRAPLWAPLLYMAVLGFAYMYYWPTLMAVVAQASPPRLKATLMGGLFLSMFVANLVIGWLGRFYDGLGAPAFWAMEGALAVAGGVLVLFLRPLIDKVMTKDVGA
jgi:POT family proton-dependent oligopeptide transporter